MHIYTIHKQIYVHIHINTFTLINSYIHVCKHCIQTCNIVYHIIHIKRKKERNQSSFFNIIRQITQSIWFYKNFQEKLVDDAKLSDGGRKTKLQTFIKILKNECRKKTNNKKILILLLTITRCVETEPNGETKKKCRRNFVT